MGSALPVVYAVVLDWPLSNHVILRSPKPTNQTAVFMLGYKGSQTWKTSTGGVGVNVTMPTINPTQVTQWAWVLKLVNVE